MTAHELLFRLGLAPLDQRLTAPGGGLFTAARDGRCTIHRGFGGYPFSDDGYDVMPRPPARPTPSSARPCRQANRTVCARGPRSATGPTTSCCCNPAERAIVRYVEGDVTVAIYDDQDAYRAARVRELAEHPCP